MKMFLCRQAGCNQVSDEPYCPKHRNRPKKNWRDAKTAPFANAVRSNQGLYETPRWRQLRAKIIERDGHRCCRCGRPDNLQVHHRRPPRGNEEIFFDENNCETVCRFCHATETASEIRERRQ